MMEGDLLERTVLVRGLVRSETHKGAMYLVQYNGETWSCTCPDCTERHNDCKHIWFAKEEWGV